MYNFIINFTAIFNAFCDQYEIYISFLISNELFI